MEDTDYGLISAQLGSLADDTPLWLPLLSNAAALIAESLPGISWAGFYLARPGRTLILGPFQGRLACTEIPFGKGVCGTAAEADAIQVVPDVHAFPGHIACDAASASEIVVPIHADDEVVAVLDIDSPLKGRFDEDDARGLAQCCRVLEERLVWDLPLLPQTGRSDRLSS